MRVRASEVPFRIDLETGKAKSEEVSMEMTEGDMVAGSEAREEPDLMSRYHQSWGGQALGRIRVVLIVVKMTTAWMR